MLLFPPPGAARSLRAALLPSNLHRKNLNGRQPLIKALLGPIPTRSLRAALSNPLLRKISISHGHRLRKTTRMQQKTDLTPSIPLIFLDSYPSYNERPASIVIAKNSEVAVIDSFVEKAICKIKVRWTIEEPAGRPSRHPSEDKQQG